MRVWVLHTTLGHNTETLLPAFIKATNEEVKAVSNENEVREWVRNCKGHHREQEPI